MPENDDDDSSSLSLQLKLLQSDISVEPSGLSDLNTCNYTSTSGASVGGQGTPTFSGHPYTLDTPSIQLPWFKIVQPSVEDTPVFGDDVDEVPEGLDPDKCYSWLLPPSEGQGSQSTSTSSASTASHLAVPVPPPPDGGWGWFVVLGAFTVSLFCDGLSYCFGVLYSELLVQFEESRSKTSLVGSIFFGVAMILGPLASALASRFGCRSMTIFGGLLSSLGFFLSYFATSINMLCITFSVVVGAGFSFCYITSVVIVAFYFDKRRALATGLAVCGTGVGTFTFAPLMDFLISEYGWRGLFLIMSAMSLNLVVCGMLFRPLQFTEAQRCQMLLEEFNKIPPGREELETTGGGRYNSSSESSSSDSDSSSEGGGCWGMTRGQSSSSEDDGDDKHVKSLSVLSLPTFVHSMTPGLYKPSAVLLEALRSSKNPHLTVQRYMKNAFFQQEQAKHQARQSRHRHKSERAHMSSPVDPQMYTTIVRTVPKLSPVDSPSIIHTLKTSPAFQRRIQKNELNNTKEALTFSHPWQKAVYISDHNTPEMVNSPTMKEAKTKHSKNAQKEHHIHTIGQSKTDFAALGSSLVDRPSDGPKKLSGFFVGRHNALSIHLPLYRSDIFYRRAQLVGRRQPTACTLGTSCPELIDPASTVSHLSQSEDGVWGKVSAFLEDAGNVLRSMVEFRLFFNPFFLLFVASNFVYYFWSDVPYMYAADHSIELGQDPTNASFLLSVIGIFNTIGQVIFGYIGDLDVNLLNIYAVVSALAGLFVALVPFVDTYSMMCALYACFGFCISVSFPLTTVLLVNYLGVARLTNAYGLLMLMQGIANLFGPPFAGWVSDNMKSYEPAFVMSGFFYAVSGLMLFLAYLPPCRRYEANRSRRASLDTSIGVSEEEAPEVRLQRLREEGSPV